MLYLGQIRSNGLNTWEPELDSSSSWVFVMEPILALRFTHYTVVIRILRYIKGILFHGLHFSSTSSLELRAYSDFDWAGDLTNGYSTIGYYIFLAILLSLGVARNIRLFPAVV